VGGRAGGLLVNQTAQRQSNQPVALAWLGLPWLTLAGQNVLVIYPVLDMFIQAAVEQPVAS
jgi:acetyl esterase/lipase